jgi:hypothetical protein
MARKFRECPDCGKRALKIATRCPQCGREILTEPVQSEETQPTNSWARPLLAVGAVLAVIGLAMAAVQWARTPAQVEIGNVTGSLAAAPPLESVPPPSPAPPSRPVIPRVSPPDMPPVPPDSMPAPDAQFRVARTWTNVHDRRSVKGDLTAVLLPGDTVLVDSLRGRWWRVALEGRVVGYVYAGTLIGD